MSSKIPREVSELVLGSWVRDETKRIVHEYKENGDPCSIHKNPALSVTRASNGWFYMCFRCGISGMVRDSTATAEDAEREIKKLTEIAKHKVTADISLPHDFKFMREEPTTEGIPYVAYNWLWKYSIGYDQLKRFNIGWSDGFNRCICPIYEYVLDKEFNAGIMRKLVGWIGRDCTIMTALQRKANKKAPAKYITRKKEGYSRIYFHSPARSDTYVLVEDVVSAIRVSEACNVNTFALLTTHVPPQFLLKLRDKKVILWLDNDQLDNMIRVVQKGSMMGLDISHIHTGKDPKSYNDFAIQESIKEA